MDNTPQATTDDDTVTIDRRYVERLTEFCDRWDAIYTSEPWESRQQEFSTLAAETRGYFAELAGRPILFRDRVPS